MNEQESDAGANHATPPVPTWGRFFWPIVLAAAALTLLLSVGVGRVIGAVLLSRSLAQTEVMPTAVPTGPNASAAMQHAAAIPGEGREIFLRGSPAPSASPSLAATASAVPVTLYQSAASPRPASPQASAPPVKPAVKVIVTHSTQTPAPPQATPHAPTPAPTPKPTFAPIIQITPAPLMGGGG